MAAQLLECPQIVITFAGSDGVLLSSKVSKWSAAKKAERFLLFTPFAPKDVRGNPGMMYIVEKDGLKYNLRTGSSTVDQTQAKWTIEINGLKDHKINGRVLKNRRIEVKFR